MDTITKIVGVDETLLKRNEKLEEKNYLPSITGTTMSALSMKTVLVKCIATATIS